MSHGGFRIAIIGAGASGILMGVKLREAGLTDFVILEKERAAGGTWRDNTYPGVACDIPSQQYCYSFAPNPAWSSRFSPGDEINRYLNATLESRGLVPHMRYGTDVKRARWEGRWVLETATGEDIEADVVIAATGLLRHPRFPDIAGLGSFRGPLFHSARWRHDVALDGRAVGIIGTGTTSAQVVPAIAGRVGKLVVFQRTPSWILDIPDVPFRRWEQALLRRFPILMWLAHRVGLFTITATYGSALAGHRPWFKKLIDWKCRRALAAVKDPELRRKLTPSYAPGCKRLVYSSTYYEAIQRPNVALVTERIESIVPEGVRTADGAFHPLDVLVTATGYDGHAFMRPMEIVGARGVTVDQLWRDAPITYRSVGIPHMPNFFTLVGPHSPVASLSVIEIAEWQAEYILELVEAAKERRVAFAPTPQATDRYMETIVGASRRTVWTSGCRSWFLDEKGLPGVYTLPPLQHRADMLRGPIWAELEEHALGKVAPPREQTAEARV